MPYTAQYVAAKTAPPPRPSGISALSHLVAHAVAPVEHVAQVVQHSAPARAYIAAHSAPAPTRSAPARSASGRFAPTTRLASAIAALSHDDTPLTPAQRAYRNEYLGRLRQSLNDPQQALQKFAQSLSMNPWTRGFEDPFAPYSPQGGLAWPSHVPDTLPRHQGAIPIPKFFMPTGRQYQRNLGFRSGSGNSAPGTRGLSDRSAFHPPAMRA